MGNVENLTGTGMAAFSGGPTCNAENQRADGYCKMPAGYGTNHKGEGRCYMHGGRPERVNEAVPQLAHAVQELSPADCEALMSLGTNAMVLARARLMERLLLPGLTTREVSDLTMSIQRLDKVLGLHLDNEDPDAAPNHKDVQLDDELARLIALERKTG